METNNKRIKTITVYAKTVKLEKQTFVTCSTKINNKWYKVKFNRTCLEKPAEQGIYIITIDLLNCSIENGVNYINKDNTIQKSNDTLWIKKLIEIRKKSEEELAEENLTKLENIFNETVEELEY